MITVQQVTNPLIPSEGLRTFHVECESFDGQPVAIAHYLKQYEVTGAVSLNGVIVPPEQWEDAFPIDGDFIVLTPHVAGGSVLRTLAAVAVTAGAIALGAVSAGAGWTLLGASVQLTASILAGAATVAGNLLISAIFSTPTQKSSSASYDFDGPKSLAQSGTVIPKGYGTFRSGGNIIASFVDIEGADQYINCLVCYGFGPARSISSIQINGKDVSTYNGVQVYTRLGSNTQTPLPNFNRIVNGYPQDTQCLAGAPVIVPGTGTLTQILQVDVQFPDGLFVLTNDGNYIPLSITFTVEYKLSTSSTWLPVIQPLTTADVVTYDTLTGDVNAYPTWCAVATDQPPGSGIVYATDSGSHYPGEPYSVSETVVTQSSEGATGTYSKTFYGEWQLTDPDINQILVSNWTDGWVNVNGCSTSPLYNRTSIYGLAAGKYDVRVTKFGSNRYGDGISFGDNNDPRVGQQLWIHSVNEIALLDLAYPNMILVGVRALATNQLSGANVSITALIEFGLRTLDNTLLPGALVAYEEDNPACVAADMALDALYGGGSWPGITAANLDRFIDEWVSWADLNDELVDDGNGGSIRRHVFNGVCDDEASLWDQLNKVGRMSRAQIIPIGRDYGVFVEQDDVPVQMFTMGNILLDSFTETWMDIDSRANQVEIQFADSTRFYKQDNPLVYMDPANQDAGVVIKNSRVDGRGITIPAQAWHLARFKERQNQFLLRTGSFKADIDAIACRPGNLVILQHDVPQWGWGGRTLPLSTASSLLLDRSDIPFVGGTAYSVILMHPSLLRYSGAITGISTVTDTSTGAVLGTQLTLSSFDNDNRVTRCIVTVGGIVFDNPILSATAGHVVIQPIPGYTPASSGQTYQLFDTDAMETRAVSGINSVNGAILLSTPLSQVPQDFSTYFYGPSGSQKIVRVANIRKASEFRATIEWIDYNPSVYTDGTPVIGETSAQITSNPQVTSLKATEVFTNVNGTNISNVTLTWLPGPDTVGVAIYMSFVNGSSVTPARLIVRIPNYTYTYTLQATIGTIQKFTVVGFDANDDYASFNSAPTVTILTEGITENLLLGSSFGTGFTYWNLTPRAGDTLAADLDNDGEATYTVAGSTLATATQLLYQVVDPSLWDVGDYLMLSAYFEDSAVSTANVGQLSATLTFLNSSAAVISSAAASATLSGTTPNLIRVNTSSTQVPTGTVQILVRIGVGGSGLSIPVGSVLTMSHLLLEESISGQTTPSAWADVDAAGNILDLFTGGSSTGLRAQGSVLPSFTGSFSFTLTDTSIVISWTMLLILWPDGAFTFIQDASITVTGLTMSTRYFAFPYFDIINGGVKFITPSTPLGSPAILSAAYDALSDAAARQDGRVSLAAGGLQITTEASGGSGTGSGGGGYSGGGGDGGGLPPGSYSTV